MNIRFEDEHNRRVYADWIALLIDEIFGARIDLHNDLYELSHAHRIEHGEDNCTCWPSPPARAPIWHLLAEMVEARRFLEIGCGLGYTAALMADAGGPEARVDTIEIDPLHADVAERELARKGLGDRVRVLRGDASDILPTLTGPYDVAFADGGDDVIPELTRLTRLGGVVFGGQVKSRFFDDVERVLADVKMRSLQGKDEAVYLDAEQSYRRAAMRALKAGQVRD